MAAAGLHLTLNSDDPAFIRSHLGEDLRPRRAAGG
jgi:adenosine deaminase